MSESTAAASTPRSCRDCPNLVYGPHVDSKTKLGNTLSVAVNYCAARGVPLNKSDVTAEKLDLAFQLWAEKCPSYGDSSKFDSAARPMGIGYQTVELRSRRESGLNESAKPNNCRECSYFAGPSETRNVTGWRINGGTCLAKAELLPSKRLQYEAKDCEFGVTGVLSPPVHRDDLMKGLTLLPVYGTALKIDENAPVRITRQPQPEPSTYVTDAEVTAEDKAVGIKAWRELKHPHFPDRFESVFLPIFDPESFPAETRAFIPRTGGDGNPELYVDHLNLLYYAASSWVEDRSPALIGPAGTGKTEFFRYAAWMMQLPFRRISITAETELYDLFGKHLVQAEADEHGNKVSVTSWVYGRLAKAWTERCVLDLDEPNTAQEAVWQGIRPLIDDAKQLVLDQDLGQVLPRNEYCFLGFAMNPAWDLRYAGTRELSEADGNRLNCFEVGFPDEATERDVIAMHCKARGYNISVKTLNAVMKIGAEIRAMSDPKDGVLPLSWGIRVQVAAAVLTRRMTLVEAYRAAVADRLDPDQREMILGIVRSHDEEA